MVAVFRIRLWLIVAASCWMSAPADAQIVCRDTPEGRVCTAQQAIIVGNSPDAFRAEIARELARFKRAVAAAKIEVN